MRPIRSDTRGESCRFVTLGRHRPSECDGFAATRRTRTPPTAQPGPRLTPTHRSCGCRADPSHTVASTRASATNSQRHARRVVQIRHTRLPQAQRVRRIRSDTPNPHPAHSTPTTTPTQTHPIPAASRADPSHTVARTRVSATNSQRHARRVVQIRHTRSPQAQRLRPIRSDTPNPHPAHSTPTTTPTQTHPIPGASRADPSHSPPRGPASATNSQRHARRVVQIRHTRSPQAQRLRRICSNTPKPAPASRRRHQPKTNVKRESTTPNQPTPRNTPDAYAVHTSGG